MNFLRSRKELGRYNIKILCNLNILAAFIIILLTPALFSLKRLSYGEISRIGEMYLPILGVILLTYIGRIEEENNVEQLIYIREVSNLFIFVIRLVLIMTLIFMMILGIILIARLQGGIFSIWKVTFGIFISSVYFGMIGLTVANITEKLSAGYLVSFSYFAFEFFTLGKYTKEFFVLSLIKGNFSNKYNILILILMFLILNFVMINRKGIKG
ncbi:hypothetical protein [Dethiothermospora halolimnae]|uniref:hypothetical protein n=1 Tax=Dethiothermospora halolimnae TaxID=3114390 RepID=UPI003CCBEA20